VFFFYLLTDVFGDSKFESYRNIIFSFFTIIAIYLTFSRTALVALISGVVFITIVKKRFKELAIIVIVLVISIFAFADIHIEGLNPFRTASTNERIKSAVNTLTIIEKNMLIGVGFNSFRNAQIRYGFRNTQGSSISNSDSGTDNSYLFVLATTGILGFIPYILSYFLLCRNLYNTEGSGGFFLTGALVSVMVGSIFLNCLFYTPLLGWLFLAISPRKST
jgi:O-antigen ligase